MKKKHGWILQEKHFFQGDCRFFCIGGGYAYEIDRAYVFDSRYVARLGKLNSETVYKVILDKNGKAKKVAGKCGWVLKMKIKPKVLPVGYAKLLKDAWVIKTRKEAREEKYDTEIIEKVRLNSKGIPIKIIGRG